LSNIGDLSQSIVGRLCSKARGQRNALAACNKRFENLMSFYKGTAAEPGSDAGKAASRGRRGLSLLPVMGGAAPLAQAAGV
jgi:hypothetical protein